MKIKDLMLPNYQISVNDSYQVKTDYNGNSIENKASFIVVSLK